MLDDLLSIFIGCYFLIVNLLRLLRLLHNIVIIILQIIFLHLNVMDLAILCLYLLCIWLINDLWNLMVVNDLALIR